MEAASRPLLDTRGDAETERSVPRHVRQRAGWLLCGIALACGATLTNARLCSFAYPVVFSHSLIAFGLGLRHAVDCDHLAAIDNVTRQLMTRGQWPVSVGFWFALGHSTVVVIMTGVLAGGYSWASHFVSEGSDLTERISLVASVSSIAVLGCIGLLNAQIASGLFRNWMSLHRLPGSTQDEEIHQQADASLKTALSSIPGVKRVFDHVSRPSRMYAVGFLFGLALDSASQVALIGIAAMTGTSGQIPPVMIMTFPIAFSCGMCFVDTANGLLMLATYSWTSMRPIQKIFYNFVVTAMSASIALVICSLELLQILARQLAFQGAFWDFIQNLDMPTIGYSIILSFVLVFAAAVVYSRRTEAPCGRPSCGQKQEQRQDQLAAWHAAAGA